jgi:hypothetical protein
MNRAIRSAILATAAISLLGCGGTYVDDPDNFNRIFGIQPPSGWEIFHSYYWRSPHFTLEFECYLEFSAPDDSVKALIESNNLVKASKTENSVWASNRNRPVWFMQGPLSDFDEWAPRGENGPPEFDDRRLYLRRSDHRWFFYDRQL